MNVLLDTHIWLWSLGDQRRLSRRVQSLLQRTSTQKWTSPISTWEVLSLAAKGRVVIRPNPRDWLEAARDSDEFVEAPLTHAVALALDEVWLPHRDPADWFLAATAREYGLTLVTADANIRQGRGFDLFYNE